MARSQSTVAICLPSTDNMLTQLLWNLRAQLDMKIPKPIIEELEYEITRLKMVLSQKDKLIKKLKTSTLRPKHAKTAASSTKNGDLYRTARQKFLEAALIEKESALTALAGQLQELDTTVRVLGDVWGREKTAIDARIKSTLNASVFPFIEKIKASKCVGDMHTYIKIVEDNLNEMNPVFTDSIVDANGDFTPSEMHVIQLIKQGKSSKEISELLNLSTKAISFHRSNIRKKLGLVNKKLNLMTYLRGQSLLR